MSHTEFTNLPHEILLVLGNPYMITDNIDVIDGLTEQWERLNCVSIQ